MHEYDYLVVGAGPAGLQMAYFLDRAGRRYLVLERSGSAGAFFTKFPRHRTLLSINKRFNYFDEDEYNLRHDWNSLLSDDAGLRFRHYSTELYPSADDLHRYLNDFAARLGLHVRYGASARRVDRAPDGGFRVATESGDVYTCRCLFIATGAVSANVPDTIPGIEHCLGYEDHPLDRSLYENKRIAILGAGNSAFEVANHLAGAAAVVHVLMGRPARHAWQTHYVGDLRAINNTIIDMYQLKSLHATLGMQLVGVTRNADGTLEAHVEEACPHWTTPGVIRTSVTYDYIIRCAGWKYVDPTLFAQDCRPEVDAAGKYPQLSPLWEASLPDMFFIGTSMAARDRRAASGFIHGFRYLIRTLHGALEERYHGVSPPRETLPLWTAADLDRLAAWVIDRVSLSSALYQLNGFLVDVIHVRRGHADCLYELPLDHALGAEAGSPGDMILISLEYGFHRYGPSAQAVDFIHPSDPDQRECAAFIHPVLRYYRGGQMLGELHLNEHLFVRYDITERVAATEVDCRTPNVNRVKNFLNRFLGVTSEEFPEALLAPSLLARVWQPWSPAEVDAHRARLARAREGDGRTPCRPA